jgi:hypothetical protein
LAFVGRGVMGGVTSLLLKMAQGLVSGLTPDGHQGQ